MGEYSVRVEMVGKKFGRLEVIEVIEGTKPLKWLCLCDCGKKRSVAGASLRHGETKSCGCLRKQLTSERCWGGYQEISGAYISSIIWGAKQRNIEYNVSNEYIWNLYLKQDRKCCLSGEEICFKRNHKDVTGTASLDRIDSSKGYIEGNVQWVHKDINIMKSNHDEKYFIELCTKVSIYKMGK